ncbi:TPA: hypothetical protein ACPYU1_004530 [Raoultella planticola]
MKAFLLFVLALLLAGCSKTTPQSVIARGLVQAPDGERVLAYGRVRFDVQENGQLQNIRLIEIEPADRRHEVEEKLLQNIRRWRYEAGNAHKGLTLTFTIRPKDNKMRLSTPPGR